MDAGLTPGSGFKMPFSSNPASGMLPRRRLSATSSTYPTRFQMVSGSFWRLEWNEGIGVPLMPASM